MYDFDALTRGQQVERLLTIKAAANAKGIELQLGWLGNLTKVDVLSLLASRKVWSGYQRYNSLLRPDKGCSYTSVDVAEMKIKVEKLASKL